jgi:hypothetical protein
VIGEIGELTELLAAEAERHGGGGQIEIWRRRRGRGVRKNETGEKSLDKKERGRLLPYGPGRLRKHVSRQMLQVIHLAFCTVRWQLLLLSISFD